MWIILLLFSVVVAVCSSSGRGFTLQSILEDENLSDSEKCIKQMQYYCQHYRTDPTKHNCARYGFIYWSRHKGAPGYINDYFEKFHNHLKPGAFLFPDEFCENYVNIIQKMPGQSSREHKAEIRRNTVECKEHLRVLKALEVHSTETGRKSKKLELGESSTETDRKSKKLKGKSTETSRNSDDLELESRMRIMLYAFYELHLSLMISSTVSVGGDLLHYIHEIAKVTEVACTHENTNTCSQVPDPVWYCRVKFPLKKFRE